MCARRYGAANRASPARQGHGRAYRHPGSAVDGSRLHLSAAAHRQQTLYHGPVRGRIGANQVNGNTVATTRQPSHLHSHRHTGNYCRYTVAGSRGVRAD